MKNKADLCREMEKVGLKKLTLPVKEGLRSVPLEIDITEKLDETRPNAPADTGGFTSTDENRDGTIYKYAGRATKDGKVPTIEELKGVCVKELNENHKEKLQCDVQKKLQFMGHSWIWTPAYCPWLQPIETFWAGVQSPRPARCSA
jgi:hypothetical protein